MSKQINIGGRLHSTEQGNVITGANEVLDDTKGKKQNVINSETDAELLRLDQSKQNNLTFDNTPTEESDNPVKSGGVYAADKALSDAIEAILILIPSAATALNQLADKNFVNSSIATDTATFRGTSETGLSEAQFLEWANSLTHDMNDYVFWQTIDEAGNTLFKRYKWNGTQWLYEYTLNNSSFTADQWAAITSGITTALVEKLVGLPTNTALQQALNSKQDALTFDNVPTENSNNPVKSGGVYSAVKAEEDARLNLSQTVSEIGGDVSQIEDVIPTGATSINKLVENASMEAYVASIIQNITASFTLSTGDGHINLTLTQVNGRVATLTLTSSDIASAQALTALTGRVTTAEENITSLGGRVSTNETDIANLQQLYNNLQQSKPVPVTALPETGQQQGVIYRIAGTTSYSDYMWNGSTWVLMATYNNAVDPRPKKASQNLVTSGGVFDNIGALDVSELNATENPHTLAQYVDLSAALAAIPTDYQKGGMSIKFVQSSDNKYVQFRLMSDEFSTLVNDWRGEVYNSILEIEKEIDGITNDDCYNFLNDWDNPVTLFTIEEGGKYTITIKSNNYNIQTGDDYVLYIVFPNDYTHYLHRDDINTLLTGYTISNIALEAGDDIIMRDHLSGTFNIVIKKEQSGLKDSMDYVLGETNNILPKKIDTTTINLLSGYTDGCGIQSDGSFYPIHEDWKGTFALSDKIYWADQTQITCNSCVLGGFYYAQYDIYDNVISTTINAGSGTVTVIKHSDALYIRFSMSVNSEMEIVYGNTLPQRYSKFNPIQQYLKDSIDDIVVGANSINILNGYTDGCGIQSDGSFYPIHEDWKGTFALSNKIYWEDKTKVTCNACVSGGFYFAQYNYNNVVIGGSIGSANGVATITKVDGAAYIQFSLKISPTMQIVYGENLPKVYMPYNPISNYLDYLFPRLSMVNNVISVGHSGTEDYDSILAAVQFARTSGEKYTIKVSSGTYDIISELVDLKGQSYIDNYSGLIADSPNEIAGIFLGNGIEIIGDNPCNTIITANYQGSNNSFKNSFSVFHVYNNEFTLKNVQITANNVRYCIHDDPRVSQGGDFGTNKGIIENCTFINNGINYGALIGAGTTGNAFRHIHNCRFIDNVASSGKSAISYHAFYDSENPSYNSQNCIINIDNIYANCGVVGQDNGSGTSDLITTMYVSNSKLPSLPTKNVETEINNLSIIYWNIDTD